MRAGSRIALLWHRAEDVTKGRRARLDGVFRGLAARGAGAEPVVYAEDTADDTRRTLLGVDGVLVWVNPITEGRDRTRLDALLREVAAAGVWVSAHPDVVDLLGTKEVLHRTRRLGWGSDVRLYDDPTSLRDALPSRLATGPLVLKQARGNGGLGVWKLELGAPGTVRVEHAHDGATEVRALDSFVDGFAGYLADGGRLVEQPFLPRVADGMVRCYLSGGKVAGYSEHLPRGFVAEQEGRGGLGAEKVMHGPDAACFRDLREVLETDWVPGMQRLLGLGSDALPAIWDADFLRGPSEAQPWVLCEINVSCVSPFPDVAADVIARTALERVAARAG
jgi:hypothetical protein